MFGLTLRNIRGRKLRYVMTTFAVVLGVAFLSTSFFLTDRLRDTFDELAVDITGELDLVVRTSVGEGDRINRLPVPEDLLEVVNADIPGVAAVAPIIQAWGVIPITVGDDGKAKAVTTQGAPQFGLNYFDIEPLTQLYVVDGRPPRWVGPIDDPNTVGEFILDTDTASDNDFEIGKTYTVSGQLGNRQFNLVGVANWRSPDENRSPGASMAAFDERTAQTFLGREGIFDEIQVGMGRTGSLWAYQQYGVEPDIMTLAKALGGGLPIGVSLLRQKVADAVEAGDHAATFGANPVVTAVALTVLEKLLVDGFLESVTEKAAHLHAGLHKLQKRWSEEIVEIRGRGLIAGTVMKNRPAAEYIAAFRERDILAAPCGPDVVRFLPPLVMEKDQIDEAVDVFDEILRQG